MIELFLGVAFEPPKHPLISVVTETKIEITAPPELTVEEKIAMNYYGCDESKQWIRKDNAKCLPKRPSYRASTSRSTANGTSSQVAAQNKATAPTGWFPVGQCTWWVWTKRPVGLWNNASSWYWQAQRDGWATGTTPRAGAIAWRSGHVAYVVSVSGNEMVVSEANYDRAGSIRTITVPVSDYTAFIY